MDRTKREILALIDSNPQSDTQKMYGLAKVYKNMPVELAAKIFELLDINSLLLIASYIDEATLSNILSYVDINVVQKIREISVSKECTCDGSIFKDSKQ
ncbi:MAG: hypothetical protein ACTJLM_03750 [Ehrlichia sp.]